ncbi:MAG: YdcH family protein [Rhodocyclaceae bacterium]|nr:YdcH family protein [Rhodocyclaceae bacterium]MCB1913423.1 YdcH family protein [Rhodocyclaceae bacterium]MCP5238342.1 YdcH family protein [Zoogloeaceae bacterium]MCW5614273.1 YdcH family protein [Rhodocyclaceae bacterium]
MVLEPHDLHHEFPEHGEAIHGLKLSNAHFARLFDEYHEVNKHVQRVETLAELATDAELEELKKQRLKLKDELYAILKSQETA